MRLVGQVVERGGLVTFGETMGLLRAEDFGPLRHARQLQLGIAGAESNVAIGVRRLGHPATWVGHLGDDDVGDLVEATLRGEGLGLVVKRDPHRPTGLMIKFRRSSSTTKVTYYRAGSAASALSAHDLPLDLIASATVLHITGITPALSASCRTAVEAAVAHARSHRVLVSFDLNYRSALWAPTAARPALRALASSADLLFAGQDEAVLLLDAPAGAPAAALASALAELGPREVIIKRGSAGALSFSDGYVVEEPGIAVTAIDHVGAGDAFDAGYLAALLDGAGQEERLHTANTAGAFAVTVAGDWEGAPTQKELALLEHATGTVIR